jgi:IclR family transcriptional regulator, pca regulon regulatory protein
MLLSSTDDDDALDAAAPGRPREFIRSVERVLELLRVFNEVGPDATVRDLAVATGMTRATARRFLITLIELGYVETDGRTFRLTARVLQLGLGFLSGLSFSDVVLPHLKRLVNEVDEASEAAVLDGRDVVYVAHVPSSAIMAVRVDIGRRYPAHVTATGKALLAAMEPAQLDKLLADEPLEAMGPHTITDPDDLRAQLAEIRERGYAVADQELETGILAIGAVVRDRGGNPVGAINLSTNVMRRRPETLATDLAGPLLRTAAEVGADLAPGR